MTRERYFILKNPEDTVVLNNKLEELESKNINYEIEYEVDEDYSTIFMRVYWEANF